MLTMETAVFACICWYSSSRDRKGQSYRVEYCLESLEEYSKDRIHKSEPEPRNGNVNSVYFENEEGSLSTLLIRPGEILESVARSLFTTKEHAIANVNLYLNFLLRICS